MDKYSLSNNETRKSAEGERREREKRNRERMGERERAIETIKNLTKARLII